MTNDINKSSNSEAQPNILIDYEYFDKYFEDTDHSEEQKRELLDALTLIAINFVSLGFGVHPMQQARATGDKLHDILSDDVGSLVHLIQSDNLNTNGSHPEFSGEADREDSTVG